MKKIYILSKMIERYEKALKYCMLHYGGLVKALDCKRTYPPYHTVVGKSIT